MIQLWFFIQLHLSHHFKCSKALHHCISVNEDAKERVGWASGWRTLRCTHPSSSQKKTQNNAKSSLERVITLPWQFPHFIVQWVIGSPTSNNCRFVSSLQLAFLYHLENIFQQHYLIEPYTNPAKWANACSSFREEGTEPQRGYSKINKSVTLRTRNDTVFLLQMSSSSPNDSSVLRGRCPCMKSQV